MPPSYDNYIIAISKPSLLRKASDRSMITLYRIFPLLTVLEGAGAWCSTEGMFEKAYVGKRPTDKPIEPEDINDLKSEFKAVGREIEVYKLEKME